MPLKLDKMHDLPNGQQTTLKNARNMESVSPAKLLDFRGIFKLLKVRAERFMINSSTVSIIFACQNN